MKYFLFLQILFLNSYMLFSQIRVITSENQEIRGYVVFESDSFVVIDDFKGAVNKIFYKALVSKDRLSSKITLKNDSSFYCHITYIDSGLVCYYDDNNIRQEIDRSGVLSCDIQYKPDYDSYILLGGTVNPCDGYLNFLIGVQMPYNIFVSTQLGVDFNLSVAYQINFGYRIFHSKWGGINISFGAGSAINDIFDFKKNYNKITWYYGAFASMYVGILFFDVGIADKNIDFSSLKLILQTGLVFKF